jgi:hypothetical protein
MSECFINIITSLLPIIRDIIYFIAGMYIFIIVSFNLPNIKKADTKQVMVYVMCLIVVWCWIFSKIVAL